MSSVGLPPGLDLSDDAIYRNKTQCYHGLKRAPCWAAMADIPEDRLIDAGTLLGYMRVVENDQNPFVVASAYILAASTAEETGLTEVLPRLRDGVVWKLLQYSGETKQLPGHREVFFRRCVVPHVTLAADEGSLGR